MKGVATLLFSTLCFFYCFCCRVLKLVSVGHSRTAYLLHPTLIPLYGISMASEHSDVPLGAAAMSGSSEAVALPSAIFAQRACGGPLAVQDPTPSRLRRWYIVVSYGLKAVLILLLFLFWVAFGAIRISLLGYNFLDGKLSLTRIRWWIEWVFGQRQTVHFHPDALQLLVPYPPAEQARVARALRTGGIWPVPSPGLQCTGSGVATILSGHQSLLDMFAISGAIPADSSALAKRELMVIPLIRTFWQGCRCFFIARHDHQASVRTMQAIAQFMVEKHTAFLLFPEGTRNWHHNGILPLKKGGFHLAFDTHSPVIPVVHLSYRWLSSCKSVLLDSWYLYTTGNILPLPVIYLRSIDTEGLDRKQDMDALIQRTWQLIQVAFEANDRLVAVLTRTLPRLDVNRIHYPALEHPDPSGVPLITGTAARVPCDRNSCLPAVWPKVQPGQAIFDPRTELTADAILGSLPSLLRPYAFGFPPGHFSRTQPPPFEVLAATN